MIQISLGTERNTYRVVHRADAIRYTRLFGTGRMNTRAPRSSSLAVSHPDLAHVIINRLITVDKNRKDTALSRARRERGCFIHNLLVKQARGPENQLPMLITRDFAPKLFRETLRILYVQLNSPTDFDLFCDIETRVRRPMRYVLERRREEGKKWTFDIEVKADTERACQTSKETLKKGHHVTT